jgi:uncharacterized membrane-anchored protein
MKQLFATFAAALLISQAAAQAPAPADPAQEMKAAFAAARAVMVEGPADIKFAEQAVLHLPANLVFVPRNEASRILKAMGNRPSADTLGMIFPQGQENWFMTARFVQSGYIKDGDAKDWNADDLLKDIKEGTEVVNQERKQRGIPEMDIVGWIERPAYDEKTHRLVWSLASRDRGAPATEEQGVNYNTYLLGREGYVSMNLVTGANTVESQKPLAKQILASVEFNKGKTYGEFNESTDHVAEYGLAALVGGVAAKKLGLFALAAAFFAKFAKVIILAVAGVGIAAAKFFKRNKEVK